MLEHICTYSFLIKTLAFSNALYFYPKLFLSGSKIFVPCKKFIYPPFQTDLTSNPFQRIVLGLAMPISKILFITKYFYFVSFYSLWLTTFWHKVVVTWAPGAAIPHCFWDIVPSAEVPFEQKVLWLGQSIDLAGVSAVQRKGSVLPHWRHFSAVPIKEFYIVKIYPSLEEELACACHNFFILEEREGISE